MTEPVESLPGNYEYPCLHCEAGCCSHYYVPVNHRDILRISHRINKHPIKFVRLDKPKIPYLEVKIRKYFTVKKYNIALKRRLNDDCIFLIKENHHQSCSIHQFKPGICVAYPFKYYNYLEEYEMKLCPDKWDLGQSFEQEMIAFLENDKKNWYAYYALLKEWNSGWRFHRSLRHFLTFITTHKTSDNIKTPGKNPS